MSKIAHTDSQSLEIHVQQLEQIVSDMMTDNIENIESALGKFEQGVNLIRRLKVMLDKTQKEIDTFGQTHLSQRNLSRQKDTASNIISLENSIDTIKQIIAGIENGSDIETALAEFKRGMHLVWHTHFMLEKAEQSVRILTSNSNDSELEEFPLDSTDL